ncbi:MAG: oxygenase MpaB family protein [Actinomycetota bacterium]
MSDPGLFGPDSTTWRVHGHLSALVGGLRALLVQTLHPLAMAGIAEHSTYKQDPLGRFRRTAQFVADTTYGTTDQAERAIAAVRRIHTRIRGVAPDGRPYCADDPALLSWVHNVEVESILVAYRRFGPGLGRVESDRYVREMTRVGAAVGADDLPETMKDLRRWVATVPDRRATKEARETVRFLVFPKLPPMLLPPYGIMAASAISLLSVRDRLALRVPSFPPAEPFLQPAARVFLGAAHIALGPPPARVAATQRLEKSSA